MRRTIRNNFAGAGAGQAPDHPPAALPMMATPPQRSRVDTCVRARAHTAVCLGMPPTSRAQRHTGPDVAVAVRPQASACTEPLDVRLPRLPLGWAKRELLRAARRPLGAYSSGGAASCCE